MNTQPKTSPLIIRLMSYLPIAEKFFSMTLAIGIVLTLANMDTMVTKVSLVGLAVTFFLSAYRVIEVPRQENEAFGFTELLGLTILPKIMWISCAVSVIGVLLLMLTDNEGSKRMFFIGGSSLAVACVILMYLVVTGVKHIGLIVPVSYRAIPLLALDLYLIFK